MLQYKYVPLLVEVYRRTEHKLSVHKQSNARNYSTGTSVRSICYFLLHVSANRFLVKSLTEILSRSKGKGKVVLLQAWNGPEGSRKFHDNGTGWW